MTPKELVKIGIERGWIKRLDQTTDSSTAYYRAWRKANQEAGLTSAGKPRKTKTHPELKGLARQDYLRAYTRLKREGKL